VNICRFVPVIVCKWVLAGVAIWYTERPREYQRILRHRSWLMQVHGVNYLFACILHNYRSQRERECVCVCVRACVLTFAVVAGLGKTRK